MVGRTVRRTRSGELLSHTRPSRRRGRSALAGILLTAVLAGCGTASGDTGIAVPTFPAEQSGAAQAGRGPVPIALPTDCAQLMDPEQAGALFGQVLGSVSVQSVRGVPEAAVNRTERTACTYRAGGQTQAFGGARNSGPVLFQLNIGRYTDAASAARQWQLNTNAERGSATASRDITVGSVPGVLVERPDETTLALVYGVDTLTFILPVAAPGQTRSAAETLPDLAQRIIPALTPTQPPSARPTPTTPPAAPAPRAGDGGAGSARGTT
ncbi:hypothetical protein Ae406Ps2_0410 [Pseudonocardia sp. Ae406_Ps2]|uniref:hypothetical protein n=1 Tax=unclassified Pseudonocardia TaxID=2619320 RepID=UPI00094B1897|nr:MULTISPECIES: hypothetical protein [unclassified Pseudonocardia]OLM00410.1 hypothetical protein Ae406Ps2_0410 [Pseudonocardia sp. Ae406_Ps2]OLM07797.1 hypothetical protein Ae331Ps2_5507c [Pseudonocardia sp. Ae331_Ps2]OLM13956.1 hypothetical protein Ae505Ps2_4085 [Pseudonocardia sp. Ae505_Ps2]OLM21984.1 hypothetical protein Ae706Ps2_0416 [Pseudonocardia sp. Ae706_Ps2]OLM31061.1 hypothetical protein Ae717Ps2_1956 [Pseudonocardia sp. Ae717_Ps2]